MKATKLKPPRRVIIHGKTFWQVETPRPEGGRQRKTFRLRDDARIFHERAKVALTKFGIASMALNEKERADALRALAVLEPYGVTLLEVAKEYAARAAAREGGRPLADALRDFLAMQERRGMAARYVGDLRVRLARFVEAYPEETTATVTTAQINDFLEGLGTQPTTRNNFRRCICVFFAWAEKTKLTLSNPAKDSVIAKAPATEPETLTPAELSLMLENARDVIRPAIALAAFCGLRQAEINRLDWEDIDLAERIATLGAGTTKTASRRTVQLPQAATAWLEPLARPSGRVIPRGIEARTAWDLCRMSAGFGTFETGSPEVKEVTAAMSASERKALRPWPANGLRHSAISYRIALTAADAATAYGVPVEGAHGITSIEGTAFACGNSPLVIKTHYLRLSKPSEARAWFSVKPTISAKNIVRLRTA